MEDQKSQSLDLVYKVDDKPRSLSDWALYSLQWMVTMFYAVVWGYALVGVEMGFQKEELISYMSAVVLTIGLSTLIQAWLGHKMAMVSGPNVIPSLAIIAAISAGGIDYAKQAFMAQAISGVIVLGMGLLGITKYIRRFWSPLILGAMVMMVGLAIAGQGLELLIELGWGAPFFIGVALAISAAILSLRAKGVWSTLAPLLVIGVGYAVFMLLGEFDWSLLTQQSSIFALPKFLPFGWEMPPLDLIFIMTIVNLMAALNLFGNLQGYSEVVNRDLKNADSDKSISILGGVETIIPGLFGVPATVAYGENLGIVLLTRVAARAFIIVAALGFVLLSFLAPVGGLMAAMPGPVAGAILLGIASNVIGIGANILNDAPDFERREQVIVGLCVFLSMGLFNLPENSWQDVPRFLTTIFSNPIISVIIFIMFFQQVLLRKKKPKTKKDKAYD